MWSNIDQGHSTVKANGGNDKVTGGSRSETIDGGAGDDQLEGGFGNDTITGGPGHDTITGGPGHDTINADMSASQCGVFQSCTVPFGNDTIDVRDGEADQVVCGPGTDAVTADALDTIGPDCETVDKSVGAAPGPKTTSPATTAPGQQGKAGGGALSLSIGSVSRAAALKRGIPVTLAAPGAGRVAARAVEGRRTVASGAAKAERAGKVTLRLKVSKAGRRALKRHGRHRLTIRVTFTPASGKSMTATKTLTVR